jgi:DUF971 family protein
MAGGVIPAGITANRNTRQLHIRWSDGHTSLYPFGLLRAACPCAECRGGHENMTSEPDPAVFDVEFPDGPANTLERIEMVGQYALTPTWGDGHHFGIFNWHYLRLLCPCDECRAAG